MIVRRAAIALIACAVVLLAVPSAGGAQTTGRAAGNVNFNPFVGWKPDVAAQLSSIIKTYRNQGKVVVFDWDNTSAARDIGDATFGALTSTGRLTGRNVPTGISPPYWIARTKFTIGTSGLVAYYDNLPRSTEHQDDPDFAFNQVTWVTQIMAGMTPYEVQQYTSEAYADGVGELDRRDPRLRQTVIGGYDRPFIYPGMVELYGQLLRNGFKVYIVSARNVWSVRYMVAQLNKKVRRIFGSSTPTIPMQNVIGVSLLMRDKLTGRFYKDRLLVRSRTDRGIAYARQTTSALKRYDLTTMLDFPIPDYFGKPTNVRQWITPSAPLLVAGDSQGDFANLGTAPFKLWLGRLESPSIQQDFVDMLKDEGTSGVIVQPTLYKRSPGFVPSDAEVRRRLRRAPGDARADVARSIALLRDAGVLPNF